MENVFKTLVDQAGSNKKFNALKVINSGLQVAPVISKLVKDRHPQTFSINDKSSYYNLDVSRFKTISDNIAERMRSSENILKLFPDIELAAQILISSILSPKDMVNTDLIYKFKETILPSDITAQILEIIQQEVDTEYQLKQKCPDILRECMFISGAYVKTVVPESSVDAIINSEITASMESLSEILDRNCIGILGNPVKPASTEVGQRISLEHFKSRLTKDFSEGYQPKLHISTEMGTEKEREQMSSLVEVTDNFKYLKLPSALAKLTQKHIQRKIHNETGLSLESERQFTDKEIEDLFFKKIDAKEQPFVAVRPNEQTSRGSIGRPMELKLPTESVIPVHVPGDHKTHIGYFIVLDEEGNPVTYNNAMGSLSMAAGMGDHSNQISSMLTQKAASNLIGTSTYGMFSDDYTRAYKGIIEGDLIQRIKNGIHGATVEIGNASHIYQIMLARTLAGQFTRLLYVPADMVTYFALDYLPDGTGKSLMDDLKVLTSLRAILLFAKVMATCKSSIALTHVNMTIDPEDPDPMKTIETGINEVVKMRQQYFPLGINTPADLVDWVQRAGLEFTFEGHPGIPNTKFDFDTKNLQHQIPDSELEELLRKQTIMAFGLSPETVDNGFASEFATTVVQNNILLSKRVSTTQDKFTPFITKYVQQLLKNDFTLRGKIRAVLNNDKAGLDKYLSREEIILRDKDMTAFLNYIVNKLSDQLDISLPKPNMTTIETQSAAFDQYSEAVDKGLEYIISSSFMTSELIGDTAEMVDAIKVSYKAYLMRRWMSENGFMSELGEIAMSDEDNQPMVNLNDVSADHIQSVMQAVLTFVKKLSAARTAGNKDVANMNTEAGGEMSSPDTSSSSGSDDTSSSSSSDDTSGGDDFSMGSGDDFGDLGGSEKISGDKVDDLGSGE